MSTPIELAPCACEVAAETITELRKRGWIYELPLLSEIDEQFKKQK